MNFTMPRLSPLHWTPLLVACWLSPLTQAAPVSTDWSPLFKGIDYASGTNSSRGGDFFNLSVSRVFRVDLKDPDIRLLTTPRIVDFNPGVRETAGMTTSRFLQTNQCQIAVNGGFFEPGQYYLPENTPMTVRGLAISGGEVVSPQNTRVNAASILFDAKNLGQVVHTNWPAISTAGFETAISGDSALVYQGANVGRLTGDFNVAPRTAIGLSQDRRFLYIVTIDGRQPGYSDGTSDTETAAWMLHWGCYDAVNLDGGGSTTMVMEDSTGKPKRLNIPSSVADSGRERTVGSHFGVFAKPVPGFIQNLTAQPEDESATITWVTSAAADAQVVYGITEDFGSSTPLQTDAGTNHTVVLNGLQPGVSYYYAAISKSNGTTYQSPVQLFTTTNPITTNVVHELTSTWMYSTENLDGKNWTALDYDDTAWSGPSEGLLWVNIRNNNTGVAPLGAVMPADPSTGFPFNTYYARAQFTLTNPPSLASVLFSGYIDDGAVVYLNGQEVQRIRMEDSPTEILNSSLALSPPCDGDSTCRDKFLLQGAAAAVLRQGKNVIAVEVHNYNPRSGDITLGFDVVVQERIVSKPVVSIQTTADKTQVVWTKSGFSLEQADSPNGPWTLTPGPVTTSPYTIPTSSPTRFYRLRK